MRLRPIIALLLFSSTLPLFSQVSPEAREGGWPIVIGGGFSDFATDYHGSNRMEGVTAWVDWNFYSAPGWLSGFGLEVEGHTIRFGVPSGFSQLREDTGEGGAIYTWRHDPNFHPYAKLLAGMGSIDFPPTVGPSGPTTYSHDTRHLISPGGGAEFRAYRNIWVRADYEYQFWQSIFGASGIRPNGFTIGVSYHFSHLHHD